MNSGCTLMVIMHTVLDVLLANQAHVQQERKVGDEFYSEVSEPPTQSNESGGIY